METLLVDPISALIGAGASLIGGVMNTSSTQSINAANLQQQMWSAQGGYLPGLVANANKAGLNPLAVLGSRGPNMAVQVGTQPGAGLQEAGREISRIDMESREADLAQKHEQLMHTAAINKQTAIDNAIKLKTLDDLEAGRIVSGPEPAVKTSFPAAAIEGSKQVGDYIADQYNRIPQWIRRPQDFYDWRSYLPQ